MLSVLSHVRPWVRRCTEPVGKLPKLKRNAKRVAVRWYIHSSSISIGRHEPLREPRPLEPHGRPSSSNRSSGDSNISNRRRVNLCIRRVLPCPGPLQQQPSTQTPPHRRHMCVMCACVLPCSMCKRLVMLHETPRRTRGEDLRLDLDASHQPIALLQDSYR